MCACDFDIKFNLMPKLEISHSPSQSFSILDTLSIYQGIIEPNDIEVSTLSSGLVIFDLDTDNNTSYFLDCNTTQGSRESLSWSSFPQYADVVISEIPNGTRISMVAFSEQDLGKYTCTDESSGESINSVLTQGIEVYS